MIPLAAKCRGVLLSAVDKVNDVHSVDQTVSNDFQPKLKLAKNAVYNFEKGADALGGNVSRNVSKNVSRLSTECVLKR
ncbi:MAG: hypothetical protein JWR19_142 [Pedosphaera sp.]|nr:hypothetical protein [Pedosphaera sp.]